VPMPAIDITEDITV